MSDLQRDINQRNGRRRGFGYTKETIKYRIGRCGCDIEDDGFMVKSQAQRKLPDTPDSIPREYKWEQRPAPENLPRVTPKTSKVPYVESQIFIKHDNADTEAGDLLGADLRTYNKNSSGDGSEYNRQLIVNVSPESPASDLRFQNGDEIVLLNETFVPEMSHEEVLSHFQDVKVDGHTRFKIVIRRKKEGRTRQKRFDWIEISAILVPETHIEKPAVVRDLRFNELSTNSIDIVKSVQLYGIPGSQLFLKITDAGVDADVLMERHEESKILRRVRYYEEEKTGRILYHAALGKENGSKYITTENNVGIVLDDEPFWFQMSKRGEGTAFMINGHFFAFDMSQHRAVIQQDRFYFAEYPVNQKLVARHGFAAAEGSITISDNSPIKNEVDISLGNEEHITNASEIHQRTSNPLLLSNMSSKNGGSSNVSLSHHGDAKRVEGGSHSSNASEPEALSQPCAVSLFSQQSSDLSRLSSLELDVSSQESDINLSQASDKEFISSTPKSQGNQSCADSGFEESISSSQENEPIEIDLEMLMEVDTVKEN